MLLVNLRVALSWAKKQPFYYSVKVLGLGIGIITGALLIAYVNFVSSYESHIPNVQNVYRLVGQYVSRESGEKVSYDFGSNAWIEPFKNEYAGLYSQLGLLVERDGVLSYETRVYDQDYFFADDGAMRLFGIKLLQGDPSKALVGPNKIILSESTALKYFGTTDDVVGKTLLLDQVHYLGVSGVFEDLPRQTNFPMDALISFDTTERILSQETLRNQLWILFNRFTLFIAFNDAKSAMTVNQDLPAFAYRRSPEQDLPILERNNFTLRLQALSDIYTAPSTGGVKGDDPTRRNTYFAIWVLSLLVILGACINYISLTVGQLQLRVKELGTRMAFGATKLTLIVQLLAESLIISLPAILLSIAFLYVLTPVFASAISVPMEIADVMNPIVWGRVALLILFICAFVSSAPVLFTRPDTIRKGALRPRFARSNGAAGSAVVLFQFAISTFAALLVMGIYLQVKFLENFTLGLDTENLIVADTRYEAANANAQVAEALMTELKDISEVESLASISINPPVLTTFRNWVWEGQGEPIPLTVSHIAIDPNFLSTYGVPLIAGRNFSLDYPSELISENSGSGATLGILITRSAVERFGLGSPERAIGERFTYAQEDIERSYLVIGVVEDFKFSPVEDRVRSVAIMQGTALPLRNISMKVSSYDPGTVSKIQAVWNEHLPGVPLNLASMEGVIDAEIAKRTEGLSAAASMALIIFVCTALIGIYAQASFVCDRYAKSIAIRKILGSSKAALLVVLLMRFFVPVVASFLLAIPLAAYVIRAFYSSFQESPGFPPHLYLLCLSGITALALITVFSHCQRVASVHPARTLRYE